MLPSLRSPLAALCITGWLLTAAGCAATVTPAVTLAVSPSPSLPPTVTHIRYRHIDRHRDGNRNLRADHHIDCRAEPDTDFHAGGYAHPHPTAI